MAKRVPIDTYCENKIPTLQKTYDGLIDYLDISSIDNTEKKIISYQTIESTDAPSRAKQLLKQGDVLVSTVRPNLNAVAVVEEETENLMVGSTGYCVLRCKDCMDIRYLFNFCQSQYFIDDMSSQATGASYPAVSNGIVRSSLIPCYSIEKQRVIAKKLDKVSELIALREQQLAKLDKLVKSRFIEMFGDPEIKSHNWEITKIGKVIESCEAGWSGNGTQRQKMPGEVAVLKVSAVTKGFFIPEECKVLDNQNEIKKYVFPQKGDLIFSRANTREMVGATAVVLQDYPELILSDKLWKIRFDYCANVFYMKHILSHQSIRAKFSEVSTGTSGSMFNVSMEKFKAIEIPLPPIELQNQFTAFVEQVDKSKMAVQQSLDKLEILKKALMQKYFG